MGKSFPRILLVNPSQGSRYPQPPLGLAMIAAVLEENSYHVRILDLNALGLSEESLPRTISEERPSIVGITAFTPTIGVAARAAKKVKETDGEVKVILGGPHGTVCPEETLHDVSDIDIVVRGEGEETVLELVKALEKNHESLERVPGISYRGNGNIRHNPPNSTFLNLDKLPFPAFDLLPLERYHLHPPFGRRRRALPIITSRGCPYRCVFCSKPIFGKKYRANSPDYVLKELQMLKDKFHVEEIKFYDDVFTLDRKRIISLCIGLRKAGIDISWTCETRVNLVDKELLKVIRSTGCYMVAYGVETGNQEIMNKLRKDVTLDQAVKAFKLTKEADINTLAYFMIGSPGETLNTIRETIEFSKKLDPDFAQFSMATPYPGTELCELLADEQRLSGEWGKYVYSDLKSSNNPSFYTRTLNRKDLKKWYRKAYTSFYLRRRYLWKRLTKMTSLGELKTNVKGLRMAIDMMW